MAPESTPRTPFRWTERRLARIGILLLSGAVVIADVFLLAVFLRVADDLPGGRSAYWYIPVGIVGILLFAVARFSKQLRLFLRDE